MALVEAHCSPGVALWLGAYPARRVTSGFLKVACYEVPYNCIALQTTFGVLAWPIVSETEKEPERRHGRTV